MEGSRQQPRLNAARIERAGSRHVRRAVFAVALGPLLALICGLVLARVHLGFWFSRPALSPLVSNAASVHTLTHIERTYQVPSWIIRPIEDPAGFLSAKGHPTHAHGWLLERVVEALFNRNLLAPSRPAIPVPKAQAIQHQVDTSGWLAPRSKGASAAWYTAIVAELTAADGRELTLVAVRHDQPSNQSYVYPYTELVLERLPDGSLGRLVYRRSFSFDVVRNERWAWIEFSARAAFITVPVAMVVGAVFFALAIRQRYRRRHGHCYRCNYDLSGLLADNPVLTCPECGSAVARSGARADST